MQLLERSGLKAFLGMAAALLLFGCQTTSQPRKKPEPPPAPAVEPPPSTTGEQPTVPDIEPPPSGPADSPSERERERDESGQRASRSLARQAESYGAYIVHDEGSAEWQIRKGNRLLTLTENSRSAIVDGVNVFLDESFAQNRGRWQLSESDQRVLFPNVFGRREAAARSIRTIVIDPGHGGSEDGTRNESLGLVEKELTLDVSERLQTHLESMGFKVALTRYDDRLVELKDRPEIARGAKADLFVSVHFNAALNADASGLETYMFTPEGQPSTSSVVAGDDAGAYPANQFDVENFELAFRIQKAMNASLQRKDRGVRKGRLAVLKTLDCPGALVEGGFLSNAEEALVVSTPVYREKLARTLAEAIAGYAHNRPLDEL